MAKTIKLFALYAIISGFAMAAMWGVFYAIGFVADKITHSPVAFWGLMAAECLTAVSLFFGGWGIITRKTWGRNLTFVSMGMLLYAVVFATGEFAQRGNPYLTGLFVVLFLATSVVLLLNLFSQER